MGIATVLERIIGRLSPTARRARAEEAARARREAERQRLRCELRTCGHYHPGRVDRVRGLAVPEHGALKARGRGRYAYGRRLLNRSEIAGMRADGWHCPCGQSWAAGMHHFETGRGAVLTDSVQELVCRAGHRGRHVTDGG